MKTFIPPNIKPKTQDENKLLHTLNQKAKEFYELTKKWNLDDLELSEYHKDYFYKIHKMKTQFVLSTTIYNLFLCLPKINKKWSEISYLEYGGGIGIPHLFVSFLGLKVYYNDFLEDLCKENENICKKLGFKIEATISGTSKDVKNYFIDNNIKLDILVSRNVIEHIADFEAHAENLSKIPFDNQLQIIETTTANKDSILALIQHKIMHYKYEKKYGVNSRINYIKDHFPNINESMLRKYAIKTRGLANNELINAIKSLQNNNKIIRKFQDDGNLCDPQYGSWVERLMPSSYFINTYKSNDFESKKLPGFWNSSNTVFIKNIVGKIFNKILYFFYPNGTQFGSYIIFISSLKKH